MKLDEVKSWKNRYKENLVDLGRFQDLEIIEKDERLKTFLNTPLKKIIDRGNELGHSYSHAFMGNWESFFDKTLLEIFSRIVRDVRGRIRFYISEGKDIEGIIFYTTKKKNKKEFVENIFVISSDLSKNSLILAKDLHALLLQLIKEYDFVRWEADFENPSCRIYKRICTSMEGTWGVSEEEDNILEFVIPGKRESFLKETLIFKNSDFQSFINEIFKESTLNHFLKRYL